MSRRAGEQRREYRASPDLHSMCLPQRASQFAEAALFRPTTFQIT
jgi:hypothetical protein